MKIGGLREDILFESKEYPLALPKKDCQGGISISPPTTPLKRPKGAAAPFMEFPQGMGCGAYPVGRDDPGAPP